MKKEERFLENTEILVSCLKLNESLFEEIYNEKIWIWYKELALIKEKPSKIYLSFKNGKMFFNENLKNEIFQKGFFSKIISSFVFSNKVLNVLNDYDPKPIEEYYNKYINYDYFKIDILQKKKFLRKLGSC